MKRTILAMLAALTLTAACTPDESDDRLRVQAPVINDLDAPGYTLPAGEADQYLFRMTWSKAICFRGDRSVHIEGVGYEVEADLAENDFSAPVTLCTTEGLYTDIFTETLADLRRRLLGADDERSATVSFRVKASAGGSTACSQSVSLTVIPYTEPPIDRITRLEPSVLAAPENTDFTLGYQGDENPLLTTIGWNETRFYLNGSESPSPVTPVEYRLEMDRAGNGFAAAVVLASTSSLGAELRGNTLNEVLTETFGVAPGERFDAELRLVIAYGSGELAGTVCSANTIRLTFVPFAPFDLLQPIYLIGDNNGWNVSDTGTMYVLFKENSDAGNPVYSFVGYLQAGWNFKCLPHESLGSYKTFTVNDGRLEYSLSDNAFHNETAGYKRFTIDVRAMTFSLEDYDASQAAEWESVGFIGTFTGWNDELSMNRLSAENRHIWTLDASFGPSPEATYHCGKFRANDSFDFAWQNRLGSEWSTPYGTMLFQDREHDVNIYFSPEAAAYRIVFNDITAQYVILKK